MQRKLKIGILAGEASGDLLGAKLIEALLSHYPNIEIEGIGGPAMRHAGCHNLFDIERLSVMGFVDPILRLFDLIKLRKLIYQHFINHKPDIFIGIDAPDFNLGLEMKLRRVGIPVVHYVSPSVWAWRQKRVHKIAKAVDLMLTLLPFEEKFYQAHQIPVRYVGHPLADQIPMKPDMLAARQSLCLNKDATYIALLPGSRSQEIRYLAEPMLLAAQSAYQKRPNLKFITAHVNEERYQEFFLCYQRLTPKLPLQFFTRRSQDIMAAANMVIVTSGTATLETMLFKKPMIIVYKMGWATFMLAKKLVKTKYIGLPNLLADELLVPELIQSDVTAEKIVEHLENYLDNPLKVTELQHKFAEIHQSLRADSADNIISSIFAMVKH